MATKELIDHSMAIIRARCPKMARNAIPIWENLFEDLSDQEIDRAMALMKLDYVDEFPPSITKFEKWAKGDSAQKSELLHSGGWHLVWEKYQFGKTKEGKPRYKIHQVAWHPKQMIEGKYITKPIDAMPVVRHIEHYDEARKRLLGGQK